MTRIALAMLLVFAAVQKMRSGSDVQRIVPQQYAIAFDVSVAMALLYWRGIFAWRVAMSAFAVLLVASTWHVASGDDCGCFGVVVSTKAIAALDFLLLLWVFTLYRHAKSVTERNAIKGGSVVAFTAVAMISGVLTLKNDRPKDAFYLTPESLVGMPVNGLLGEGRFDLNSGMMVILLLKKGCSDCEKVSRGEVILAEPLGELSTLNAWLDGTDGRWLVSDASDRSAISRSVEFTGSADWTYVAMPSAIVVEDGVVRKVISRDELLGRVRHAVRSDARD